MTSKRKKPDDWNFKIVEVDVPDGGLADFDLDEWLADNAVEIYHRLEAAGEQAIAPTPVLNNVNERIPSSTKKDFEIGLIPALAQINNQPLKSKSGWITGKWDQKKTFSHLTHMVLFALEAKLLPNDNLGVQPC